MIGRSLNVESDPFRPCEDSEKILGPEVPYMSAIGGLLYLANCTRPDIAFATNILARYSSAPTRRHWDGIKHVFRYLQETIALQEACRECVWLRSISHHIQESSGIVNEKESTKIFEDNSACVAQLKEGYIKSDTTKHIRPRFFSYVRELEKNKEVDIEYVRSCDNPADLFTKALPTTTFRKHVYGIGMRHLRDL
ncbi:secreted RxLR effector protein 161-like [Brassica napus]|uniref:secreted RxLR effector protein 161-like n=1 Tax=Brassica napus TaxID=3708 RepID=UPI002078E143|nr:secreted RxLR effector protein 161-like [Brassica napus]